MDLDCFDYGKNHGKLLENIKEWIISDGFSKDVDERKHTLVVKKGDKEMILRKSFIIKEKPRNRTRNEVFLNEYSGLERSIKTIDDWLIKISNAEEGKGQMVKTCFLIKTYNNGYELKITADVIMV